MRIKKSNIVLFLLPCLLLFAFIYLLPLIMVFVTSFFDWKAGGIFEFVGMKNYINGLTNDLRLRQSLKNTGVWVILQSTIHVALGTIIAILLSRKFRGWKVLRTVYMIPNVISAAALGVILLNVFNPQYGIINELISMITGTDFVHNWYHSTNTAFFTVTLGWILYPGLVVIIVLAGIMSIPSEIIDAAQIDGASKVQIDLKVKLPMIRTIMGTCVIIAATSMLREFELIYLTTNGGPGDLTLNLPLYLYKTSLTDNNYGYANMMGVILIGIGVIIVFIINKIFRMNESDY